MVKISQLNKLKRISGVSFLTLILVGGFALHSTADEPLSPLPEQKRPVLKKTFPFKPLAIGAAAPWTHPPYKVGYCNVCHVSDNPEDPGKLRAPMPDLCFFCHKATEQMVGAETPHKPAKEHCGYCHNPHNSTYRMLLHAPTKALCGSCHEQILEVVENAEIDHAPAKKGDTCKTCHTPHGSHIERLLLRLPSDMCLGCHGRDGISDNDGVVLENIKTKVREKPFHHEPIDKKNCSACHLTHGGSHFRLLMKKYPHRFYESYAKENYALCLDCHNMERTLTELTTTTLTDFRDGDKNLHAVHVSKPKKGRTCRACHGEHATDQLHLIRDHVPFGKINWRLDINYVKTKTGGLCERSCHEKAEYRNK